MASKSSANSKTTSSSSSSSKASKPSAKSDTCLRLDNLVFVTHCDLEEDSAEGLIYQHDKLSHA